MSISNVLLKLAGHTIASLLFILYLVYPIISQGVFVLYLIQYFPNHTLLNSLTLGVVICQIKGWLWPIFIMKDYVL